MFELCFCFQFVDCFLSIAAAARAESVEGGEGLIDVVTGKHIIKETHPFFYILYISKFNISVRPNISSLGFNVFVNSWGDYNSEEFILLNEISLRSFLLYFFPPNKLLIMSSTLKYN